MNKYEYYIIAVLFFLNASCTTKTNTNVRGREDTQSLDYVINKKLSASDYSKTKRYVPKNGLIPTAKVAFQVAETILINIYGKEIIDEEKPFSINLENDIWIIEGHIEDDIKGGVAYMEIRKSDGQILKVIHTE